MVTGGPQNLTFPATVEAHLHGSRITVTANGLKVFSFEGLSLPVPGRYGLFAIGDDAYFDDFVIEREAS